MVSVRATGCSRKELPFEMLEPCAVKVARTVLRGLGTGNSPRLPDPSSYSIIREGILDLLILNFGDYLWLKFGCQ